MFSEVSSSFGKIFASLSSKKHLTDRDLIQATEEIKIALLSADVIPSVANVLIADIKNDLIGKALPKDLSPSDAVASIVHKRLMSILGNDFNGLKPSSSFEIILLVGPYGSGKTTTAVKLAKQLIKKHQIKACVASVDTKRPAAAKQLQDFSTKNGIDCMEYGENLSNVQLTQNAIMNAQKMGYGLIILDSFGIESDEGYEEINELYKTSKANSTIVVLDSMIGQQSVKIAQKFMGTIPVSGVILTKTDGDTRGGVAINIHHETKLQIQYIGTGEDGDSIEEFHPERISSRLLDRGDIETIVEKAYDAVGEDALNNIKNRVIEGKMTFDDYLTQIRSMKKMGGIGKILSFLPGASQLGSIGQIMNNLDFAKQEAIILSMTKKERLNPELLEKHSSRRVRIAKGSGLTLADVKKLMNQLAKMRDASKAMQKMQNAGISLDDLKNFDINKLKGML
jgi:signal recognition particle subunit SRP54